jgi:hypothetical protein
LLDYSFHPHFAEGQRSPPGPSFSSDRHKGQLRGP